MVYAATHGARCYARCTLRTVHATHGARYAQCTVHATHGARYAQCTLRTVHATHSARYALCTLRTVHATHSARCTLRTVHATHSARCTQTPLIRDATKVIDKVIRIHRNRQPFSAPYRALNPLHCIVLTLAAASNNAIRTRVQYRDRV